MKETAFHETVHFRDKHVANTNDFFWECDHWWYFLCLNGRPVYTRLCLTSRTNNALEKTQTFRWRKLLVSALIPPIAMQICEREKQPEQSQKPKPVGLSWRDTGHWCRHETVTSTVLAWTGREGYQQLSSLPMVSQLMIPIRLLPASRFCVIYAENNKGFGFGFTYRWDKTVVAILFSIKNPIFNEYRYCP